MTIRTASVTVPVEGGEMPAYAAYPESGGGPGLLLIQEVFGLCEHIRGRARRFAGMGYVVLAPALFWRTGTLAVEESEGVEAAMAVAQRLERPQAVANSRAALAHLRGLAEVTGPTGVVGNCLDGAIGFHVAAEDDPDAAVLYYPSGGPELAGLVDRVKCPMLLEFAGADQFIPAQVSDAIIEHARGREEIEIHVQPRGGHAFDNEHSPFHHAESAAAAWADTRDFLRRRLPVRD
jgi:carboxymethylenebutenolidase